MRQGSLGFWKWFDFSHQHTFSGKCRNIGVMYTTGLLWLVVITTFFVTLQGLGVKEVLIIASAPSPFMQGIIAAFGPITNPFLRFFYACILAPFTEEIIFRAFPLVLALWIIRSVEIRVGGIVLDLPSLLFWTAAASSVIFGWMHGSPINILFQGVGGLFLSWVYLKNNNSFASAVAYHMLWNFMLLIGFPIIIR